MGARRGRVAGLLVGLVLVAGCGKTRTQEAGPPPAGEQPAPPDTGPREPSPDAGTRPPGDEDAGTPPDEGPGSPGGAKLPSTGQTEWTRQLGGDGREHALAVVVDADGDVLLGGDYEGQGRFGGEPLPNHGTGGPRGHDDRDAVVAKYSPSGEHLWSRGFGGTGSSAWVKDVALQGREVLVLGESTAGLELEGAKVSAGAFLLRLDAGGRLLRAVSLEVPADHLVAEPSGDLLVVGARDTSGSGTRTTLHLTRLDTLGTPRWRREFTSEGPARVRALERDGSGHLYMAGEYKGALRLGRVSVPAGPGAQQPFVAKLSKDGEAHWARGFSPPPEGGSDSTASVQGLAVGKDGQVFVSGTLSEGLELDGERHVSMAYAAGFLAALDAGDGKARWVRWFSSDNSASMLAVRVDVEGAVLVAGLFHGTMLVGGFPLTNRHEYREAVLVAKYRPSGEHVWSRVLSDEQGFWMGSGAMACAPSGRVVLPSMAWRGARETYDVMLWGLLP